MKLYKLNQHRLLNAKQYYQGICSDLFPVTKRILDVVISLLTLVLLSPLLIIVGLLIKQESNGPALFKQQRVGLYGKTFTMFKFRSMSQDAQAQRNKLERHNEMSSGVLFKIKNDPRITPLGKIIRKTSIDELPQLINVLQGEMSLVGPRPALPNEVSQYSFNDRTRLNVLPGITCLWQVMGRSEIPFEQQVKLDLKYIKEQSLLFDVSLLLKTIPAVIKAKGAY